jgi:hypothetical protein
MTQDPMRDLGEGYYPFQRGYEPRGSPTPYVVGILVLAILAVVSLSIVSVDDADMSGLNEQITASDPAPVNSGRYN